MHCGRSIDYSSSSSQLLDGHLLQRFLFQSFKFGRHISVWQLLCESQLWQIVVFGIDTRQGCKLFKVVPPHLILVAWICVCIIIGVWIELLMHWGRLIDFTSSSSQLFIGYLLQDFSSSHPNLVITFLFGNYSVRVTFPGFGKVET
jgi:hypothetical protein